MSLVARVVLVLIAALSGTWACAAIWLDGPASRALAALLALGFAVCAIYFVARCRSLFTAYLAYGALLAIVAAWWLSIAPSNDREWLADVERPATATLDGNRLTIENVRNFDYRSDDEYTERSSPGSARERAEPNSD